MTAAALRLASRLRTSWAGTSWANTFAGAALGIGAVTVLARLVGFGRGLVFVRTVGSTCLGDTYYAANTVPNLIFETVAGGALASAVVPVLAGPVAAGDARTVQRVTGALLTWTLLVLTPLAVAGALLARPLMGLLAGSAGGYDHAAVVALGARMLIVFMPQVVLYGVGITLTGLLQAHRRFLGPALAPLLSSLVVIVAYVVFALEGRALASCSAVPTARELTLSVGTTLGVAALSLGLLVPARRTGVRLRPAVRFPAGVGRRVGALAIAGVAALAAQQVSLAVVLRLSYGGPPGTLVLYNLAWTLFLLPWAVVAVPLATSAFPALAAHADSGDHGAYAGHAARTTRAVVVATSGAAAVLAATALPVARLLVLHARGHPDPAVLAAAVVAFAPGLLGYAAVAHLGRALYARHDGRRAATATVVGWLAVVGVDLALAATLPTGDRLTALAAGNTAGMLVAGGLLLHALRRAAGASALDGVGRALVVGVVAAVAAGVAGWWLARALPGGGLVAAVWQAPVVALMAAGAFGGLVLAADRAGWGVAWRR